MWVATLTVHVRHDLQCVLIDLDPFVHKNGTFVSFAHPHFGLPIVKSHKTVNRTGRYNKEDMYTEAQLNLV